MHPFLLEIFWSRSFFWDRSSHLRLIQSSEMRQIQSSGIDPIFFGKILSSQDRSNLLGYTEKRQNLRIICIFLDRPHYLLRSQFRVDPIFRKVPIFWMDPVFRLDLIFWIDPRFWLDPIFWIDPMSTQITSLDGPHFYRYHFLHKSQFLYTVDPIFWIYSIFWIDLIFQIDPIFQIDSNFLDRSINWGRLSQKLDGSYIFNK